MAGLGDDDDDDDDEEEEQEEGLIEESPAKGAPATTADAESGNSDAQATTLGEAPTTTLPTTNPSAEPSKPRNYFSTTSTERSEANKTPENPLSDPTILAALRKASTLDPSKYTTSTSASAQDNDPDRNQQEVLAKKRKRHEEMLSLHDRDAADLDLGFGSSRVEDEEGDGDEARVKLSAWGGGGGADDDDDGADGGGKGAAKKRKRGPKKKKGDVNSAADVLRVVEMRKNRS